MSLKNEAANAQTEIDETIESESTSDESGAPDATGDDSGDAGSDAEAESAVEIDGIKFKSEKDALEWALENKNKLERDREIADAYRTGIQDATSRIPGAPAAPPEPPKPIVTEEEFYANPTEAIEKVTRVATERAVGHVARSQAQKAADEKVWSEFSGLHPDLADFREDVELLANSPEHLQIIQTKVATQGMKAGYDYVAQKVRAKFQLYAERSKSSTVLPRGNGGAATPSGAGKNVTPPKKTEKVLSLREQVRQHNQRFTRKSE